jgi:hypothetical protein
VRQHSTAVGRQRALDGPRVVAAAHRLPIDPRSELCRRLNRQMSLAPGKVYS